MLSFVSLSMREVKLYSTTGGSSFPKEKRSLTSADHFVD